VRLGVLGGGQLGRMLALAAARLGVRCRFLDRTADAVAGHVGELVVGSCEDESVLARFAEGLDAVTFEFENVPAASLDFLEKHAPTYPGQRALAVSQDRLHEKSLFRKLGVPTAEFRAADDYAALAAALGDLGAPALLKTRRFGYDGKGQHLIESPADAERAWDALGGGPCILEGFVHFERELSLIAVRGRDGAMAFYPLIENRHKHGILSWSLAPAPGVSLELQDLAEGIGADVMAELDYVGVLAIEFFELGGRLYANEMAPRVHNSGHLTLDACACSQFENHVRAVLGLALGPAQVDGYAAMLNLVGETPPLDVLAAMPELRVHLYGKTPRPGRKLGHATVIAADRATLVHTTRRAAAALDVDFDPAGRTGPVP